MHVTVAISNPADPEHRWEELFLVNTREVDCYVPANRLRTLGIVPIGKRTYQMTDGLERTFDAGLSVIELMGELAGGLVIFGEDDDEPRLGAAALASLGIEVDHTNQRLNRRPAVRLMSMCP